MRLSKKEIEATKMSFLKIFRRGDIYLFGSRVDESKKGGDIDIYIIPEANLPFADIFNKKIDFLVELKQKIGDQKIDVLISKDKNRPIEQEALRSGIRL